MGTIHIEVQNVNPHSRDTAPFLRIKNGQPVIDKENRKYLWRQLLKHELMFVAAMASGIRDVCVQCFFPHDPSVPEGKDAPVPFVRITFIGIDPNFPKRESVEDAVQRAVMQFMSTLREKEVRHLHMCTHPARNSNSLCHVPHS